MLLLLLGWATAWGSGDPSLRIPVPRVVVVAAATETLVRHPLLGEAVEPLGPFLRENGLADSLRHEPGIRTGHSIP